MFPVVMETFGYYCGYDFEKNAENHNAEITTFIVIEAEKN